MIIAGLGSTLYNLLFLGHIAAFLVAFAPAVIHPILSVQVKGDGDGTAFIRLAEHIGANSRRIHFPALLALGGFGLAMVFASDEVWAFDQTWVSLAFLVWLAICGVVTGVIMRAGKRVADGDESAERQVAMGGQLATVLLLVMLYLMIWKPGA